ncbi:MAG: site-specific DNA-methyltransferase [Gammaproteobacteria bacterium]|nr:site-specific DNA-methyltransferase [Gammaproteobacteria bacterium]MDA7970716.1 site-specific DNA-methyltransferase [Gammaproteobacteria bacterium]MDA7996066.1 site-specific DNA-methyltransferase [Gammaproteobacteria bacterium]MDA8022095.1 site-specific DNA-methyltransferase [Gammaproteobacteria bacterium]CAJ2376105.1 MAG: Methyltransferase [Arenicellales bacterium IbO2]
MKKNILYYGDCLEVMEGLPDNSVDLIYLDPPFNSKADYNILFGARQGGGDGDDLAQLTAFTDTWEWDEKAALRVEMMTRAVSHPAHRAIRAFGELYPDGSGMFSYLSYMAERIAMMPRLLKDTGSVYLHCDPTASHYLKIVMDSVFGAKNFRNEIVWCYRGAGYPKKDFGRRHDIIFRYTAGDDYLFNLDAVRGDYAPATKARFRHYIGNVRKGGDYGEQSLNPKGKHPDDWWAIQPIAPSSKERLGYPTQKPLALLERIVQASSNPGGLVLDPFCGCGTTIEAAHLLKRDWIGIDISAYAIEVVRRERMRDLNISIAGIPKDLKGAADFAKRNPFDFEKWAVTRIPGFAPNKAQRGDGGIDGRARIFQGDKNHSLCIAQVKGGAPGIDSLRAFSSIIAGGAAAIGVFITLEKWETPSVKKCISQAGTFKRGETKFNRLVMYSIAEYFEGAEPKLPALAHPRTGEAMQAEIRPHQTPPGN